MIKPNSKLALTDNGCTQKYDIKEPKQERHHIGITFGCGRLFYNAEGEICYAIPNCEAEIDKLNSRFMNTASFAQEDIGILNYRYCYEDSAEIVFVFAKSKQSSAIRECTTYPFSALHLLYDILVEVQHYPMLTLTIDTVFFNENTHRVWTLPLSESDDISEPDLIYQAAWIAVWAENHGDLNTIKPYHSIIARCLSPYASQRYQTITECLQAIRPKLDAHNEVMPVEKEPSFLEDMNAFVSKLKSIRLPKISFALEERETKGQLNETHKETESFSRLPHPDNSHEN